MISQKIFSEYCLLNCKFTEFSVDLLPKNDPNTGQQPSRIRCSAFDMADQLHVAIKAMSIEDDEPITLLDSPIFKVFNENSTSLLGRLLNPDCQSMERMIEDMPRVWRVYNRVRGIALSRDKFNFIFQCEEDLQIVLNERPWSYNYWTMFIERWTPDPSPNFLSTFEVCVRIQNIPANHYTIEMMDRLGSAIGKVEEIAYDPKASQPKDYIRARILFHIDSPARNTKNLNLPSGEMVVINYEYEKLRKRCFNCLHLTHEKPVFPLLKKIGPRFREIPRSQIQEGESSTVKVIADKGLARPLLWGPPGFPAMFPQLSKQDQVMALQYISHDDKTERMARIQRVKQPIVDLQNAPEPSFLKISHEVDKGKGHVFGFEEDCERLKRRSLHGIKSLASVLDHDLQSCNEAEPEHSFTSPFADVGSTVFKMGSFAKDPLSGILPAVKRGRNRPSAWKRCSRKASLNLQTTR